MARPTGVTIIAALMIIGGVLGIIASIAIIGLLGSIGFGLAAILGIVALVSAVLSLVAGIGLWQLKPWGWTLAFAIAVVNIVVNVVSVLTGNATIAGVAVNTIINAVVIYYLNTPEVKAAFGRS